MRRDERASNAPRKLDDEAGSTRITVHVRVLDAKAKDRVRTALLTDPAIDLVEDDEDWDVLVTDEAKAVQETIGHDDAEPLLLSPRETEVLELMATGASNKLIARRLAISAHTAKFHVTAIMGKLGATSRTDAVARAMRAGLIMM